MFINVNGRDLKALVINVWSKLGTLHGDLIPFTLFCYILVFMTNLLHGLIHVTLPH